MDNRPIGIFDSGVGGLTVFRELARRLPHEDIIYFGDTARVPYGTKSRPTIIRFATENILFLMRRGVKLIIVACNTASSVALPSLQRHFRVPIMGVIEAGAADALRATKTKRVGIIGTSTTIASRAYERQLTRKAKGLKIFSRACPLFVPLAEEGWFDGDIAARTAGQYLDPLKQKGIDTLILGCTHYPLLKSAIGRVMGKRVTLIDSALSTARAARQLIDSSAGRRSGRRKGRHAFFVTDEPQRFRMIGERFLRKKLTHVKKVGHGL